MRVVVEQAQRLVVALAQLLKHGVEGADGGLFVLPPRVDVIPQVGVFVVSKRDLGRRIEFPDNADLVGDFGFLNMLVGVHVLLLVVMRRQDDTYREITVFAPRAGRSHMDDELDGWWDGIRLSCTEPASNGADSRQDLG